MSATPDDLPPLAAPAALAAFLKGVERRGAVLAELQAGSADHGDAALCRAMTAFQARALECPMALWPRLFWAGLLQQPALRRATRASQPDDLPAAAAAPGLRATLLLRLVAGLDEAAAAQVLGVAPETVRRATGRVVPRDTAGTADAAAWVRLRQDLQRRVRELPAERALRLSRGREAALAATAENVVPAQRPAPRWRRVAATIALVALALAGTWWMELPPDSGIRVAELRAPGRPASRYSATAGLVGHPDFAVLADPDAERIARDIAFLSWSASQVNIEAVPADPLDSPLAPPLAPPTEAETADEP